MTVSRRQIISRGLANRCANCGEHTLFHREKYFGIHDHCANCGMKFDRGEGFFLGPFVINYTVTVALFIVPVILLHVSGRLGLATTIAAAGAGAIFLPMLLYRRSWSWWLMGYFYFLPQKLPQNRGALGEDAEE